MLIPFSSICHILLMVLFLCIVRGIVYRGCRVVWGRSSVCCLPASVLVLLCIHVVRSIEHLPVSVSLAVVVPVDAVVFAVVVRSRQVLF